MGPTQGCHRLEERSGIFVGSGADGVAGGTEAQLPCALVGGGKEY